MVVHGGKVRLSPKSLASWHHKMCPSSGCWSNCPKEWPFHPQSREQGCNILMSSHDTLWILFGSKEQRAPEPCLITEEKKNPGLKNTFSSLRFFKYLAKQTLRISDLRPELFSSFLRFNLFLRILSCRYATRSSAVVEKNRSQTISLSWVTLEATRAIMSRTSRMTASGKMEL